MLSNWRNPPRPVEKSSEQGSRITGDTGKSVDGERDSAGSVVARKRSNVRGAKRPAGCNGSNKTGGKGEMTKAPISLRDLRRNLYVKAKAEPRLAHLETEPAAPSPYPLRRAGRRTCRRRLLWVAASPRSSCPSAFSAASFVAGSPMNSSSSSSRTSYSSISATPAASFKRPYQNCPRGEVSRRSMRRGRGSHDKVLSFFRTNAQIGSKPGSMSTLLCYHQLTDALAESRTLRE